MTCFDIVACHLVLLARRSSSALIFFDAAFNCWLDTWAQLDFRGVPSSASHASFTSFRVRRPYFKWTFTLPGACLLGMEWWTREINLSILIVLLVHDSPPKVVGGSGRHNKINTCDREQCGIQDMQTWIIAESGHHGCIIGYYNVSPNPRSIPFMSGGLVWNVGMKQVE